MLSKILLLTTGADSGWTIGATASMLDKDWSTMRSAGLDAIILSLAIVNVSTEATEEIIGVTEVGETCSGTLVILTDSIFIGVGTTNSGAIFSIVSACMGAGVLISIELVSASACTVGIGLGAFAFSIESASDSGPNTTSSDDFCMKIVPVVPVC